MESQRFAAAIGALVPSIMLLGNLQEQFVRELPAPCNAVLDRELLLRADAIYPYLECMGARGREMYVGFYHLDLVLFPLIYSTFLLGLLARLWQSAHPLVWLLPLLGALADVLENIGMCFLLLQFPQRYTSVEVAVSAFTRAKWLLGSSATVLVIVGALRRIVLTLRPHDKALDTTSKAKAA